ncbi:MAG: outer membrane protein assembly factor BamE [Zavarzinella sp.]|nr:outer membrane protein assembly factor BamE [Zavarzinella sp.]
MRMVVGGLAAVAVTVVVVTAMWPASAEERTRRIKPGMTRAQVEEILGAPPGNYGTDRWTYADTGHWELNTFEWEWDEGDVVVEFNSAGLVREAVFEPNPNPPSVWDRWRSRLPW